MTTTLARTRRAPLTKYNPRHGMQRIAVAEVAIKEYARAKDSAGLGRAIRAKLIAQAEFVEWWDGSGHNIAGRPRKNPNRSVRNSRAGTNGLPDSMTISRWRRLTNPAKFDATFESIFARSLRTVELGSMAHVGQNSGEHEWYTPREYIDAARAVLGDIDLDPASSPEANTIVQAARFHTRDDDGRTQPWSGRVWMNPPYSQ